MPSPIVIAGAGIGGLTAALAVAARGFECVIVEKAAELIAVGAGVQLSPNASHILIGLGLRDALDAVASRPAAAVLNSVRAGNTLTRLPFPQDDDAPYWTIHRADLQAVLCEAVANDPCVDLRLGCGIEEFKASSDDVRIALKDVTLQTSALIAADGVHSRLRKYLFPNTTASATGRAAWRGLTRTSATSRAADVQVWMGPRAHLVAYPVAAGQTNLVVTLPDGETPLSARSGADIAAELVRAGWPGAPCQLIAEATSLTRYPLLTTPPLPGWNKGRVALLGDAAHAMLPFAAQGAGMAIEDAAVLAQCLSDNPPDIPAGLARYARQRRPRVDRVMQTARQSGRIYHLRGPMALARDAAIRLLGPQRLMLRQSWIHDWRI